MKHTSMLEQTAARPRNVRVFIFMRFCGSYLFKSRNSKVRRAGRRPGGIRYADTSGSRAGGDLRRQGVSRQYVHIGREHVVERHLGTRTEVRASDRDNRANRPMGRGEAADRGLAEGDDINAIAAAVVHVENH